jgi:hypothetical protein
MRTLKQIEASRANGAKSLGPVTVEGRKISTANSLLSTGPVTPEGKALSSRNATRHGLLADAVVLDEESREEFLELLADLHEELQPKPGIETRLVEVMAVADWRCMRIWSVEKEQIAVETQKQVAAGCHGTGAKPARCTSNAIRNMVDTSRAPDLFVRYDTRYRRQYMRIWDRLEARRDERKKAEISKRSEPADVAA